MKKSLLFILLVLSVVVLASCSSAKLEELQATFEAEKETLIAEAEGKAAEAQKALDDLTAEKDALIAEAEGKAAEAQKALEDLTAEKDALIAEAEGKAAEAQKALEDLAAEKDALIAEAEAKAAEAQKAFEEKQAEMDQAVADLTAEKDALIAELEEKADAVQEKVEDAQAAEEESEAEPAVEEIPAEEPVLEVVEEPVAEESVEEDIPAEEPEAVIVEEPVAVEPVLEVVEEPAAEEADADLSEIIVAEVGDIKITAEEFRNEAFFERCSDLEYYYYMVYIYSMYGLPIDDLNLQFENILGESGSEEFAKAVLVKIFHDKVVEAAAKEAGLSFTNEDITEELKTLFSYVPQEDTEAGETALGEEAVTVELPELESDADAEFYEYIKGILDSTFLGEIDMDFLNEYALYELEEDALFNAAIADMAFEAESVWAQHILVESYETAMEILAKLDEGADWDELAAEYSMDQANAGKGGDLGWFTQGTMIPEFESAAWALEPGTITEEPVQSQFGYHIIRSEGKENRALEGNALESAKNEAYQEWASELDAAYEITVSEDLVKYLPDQPVWEPVVMPEPEETAAEPVVEEAEAEAVVEEPVVEEAVEEPAN